MTLQIANLRIRFPRVPFFRVFYSLTYTLLYFITLVFLAVTPISMIYSSIRAQALQYTFMIGGAYILTAILVIFIYSSRLYTNRSVLSAVGKAYVPIEEGEVGKLVRKMIAKQLERSAIVAWESRPRDLFGEILLAEQEGLLPTGTRSVNKNDYVVGTEIRVDPQNPPWGDVQHPGWSSPSHNDDDKTPEVQFDNVVQEIPHLIEARAVSLAPPDSTLTIFPSGPPAGDPTVVAILQRPTNMGLREYLTKLSYLQLIQPPILGQNFLSQYERARFSGQPIPADQFNRLMSAFAKLLDGMTGLDATTLNEIRTQTVGGEQKDESSFAPLLDDDQSVRRISPQYQSMQSRIMSAVTAREGTSSSAAVPYLQQNLESKESLGSVIHRTPEKAVNGLEPSHIYDRVAGARSSESLSLFSDAGSVLRHRTSDDMDR